MSTVEIVLIVIACLIPVVSLIIILPKHLKFAKSKPASATPTPAEPIKTEQPKVVANKAPMQDYNTDEFKSYLNKRKEKLTKPVRNNNVASNLLPNENYFPRRITRASATQQPQTLIDEIRNLSPELKALIFSGALNRKDYDKE